MAFALTESLPALHRVSDWIFCWSPRSDGISYKTFYNKTEKKGPSVLLIRTTRDEIFGAYCSDSWRPASAFYGTGETFVFSFGVVKDLSEPYFSATIAAHKLKIWKSTHKTDLFMYSDHKRLAIGGGGNDRGSAALMVDDTFNKLSSVSTKTFGNDGPLSFDGVHDFIIADMELWVFDE